MANEKELALAREALFPRNNVVNYADWMHKDVARLAETLARYGAERALEEAKDICERASRFANPMKLSDLCPDLATPCSTAKLFEILVKVIQERIAQLESAAKGAGHE